MTKTILLFGGRSEERLVSTASAQNLVRQYAFSQIFFWGMDGGLTQVTKAELTAHQKAFEREFVPKGLKFANSVAEAIEKFKSHVVFIGLHGTEGEDGQLQSIFEKNRIAFTGSGSTSSQNSFDKSKAKKIVKEVGIPVTQDLLLSFSEKSTWVMRIREFYSKFGQMVVKPVANGSSVGLFVVRSGEQLEKAMKEIPNTNLGSYMLEKFVVGRELTVGVIEKNSELMALPASETVLEEGFNFDYQGKYLGRGSKEITPAIVDETIKKQVQDIALKAHRALKCSGYSRSDIILSEQGPVYLETNTLPGLTKASFIPQQLEAAGMSLSGFIEDQIEWAAKKYQ